MFQATTLEGWYFLMSMITNGYSKYITIFVFITAIQICHYLLVNLTLAVMVSNLRKQNEEELDSLIDKRVEIEARIAERKCQLQLNLKEETNYSLAALAGYCLKTFISFREEEEPAARRYDYKFILLMWRMTIHPLYRSFFIVIIIIYVIVLSSSV